MLAFCGERKRSVKSALPEMNEVMVAGLDEEERNMRRFAQLTNTNELHFVGSARGWQGLIQGTGRNPTVPSHFEAFYRKQISHQ